MHTYLKLQFFWMGGAIGIVVIAMLTVPTIGWRWLLGFAAIPVTVMSFVVPVSFHGNHIWCTTRLRPLPVLVLHARHAVIYYGLRRRIVQ